MGKTFDIEAHTVINNLPITDVKLKEMVDATRQDSQLVKLIQITKKGWPSEKHKCPKEIIQFWNHRFELSVHDGVPKSMRSGNAETNP